MNEISIHALLAESDNKLYYFTLPEMYFYPRSPCGERRQSDARRFQSVHISIHALLAESDALNNINNSVTTAISIHALLAESDSGY